jgi:hypothetical protein
MMSRGRWLACAGLVAGTYLVLAGVRGLGAGDFDSALVYAAAAVVTFAFAAAVLPIMVPRRKRRGDGPRGGGGGDDPGPDEPPQPPWWPEFEREFREHVRETDTPERSPTARA